MIVVPSELLLILIVVIYTEQTCIILEDCSCMWIKPLSSRNTTACLDRSDLSMKIYTKIFDE